MLFAEPRTVDPIGEPLVAARTAFLSHEIYGSFGRYALSQLDRLEHNQRLAEHRATVIGWLRDDPSLSLDGRRIVFVRGTGTANDIWMSVRESRFGSRPGDR